MGQYFEYDKDAKDELFTYDVNIFDKKYTFYSNSGVFAKNGLDFGSRLLMEEFKNPEIEGKLLDLGCGNGIIGITISKEYKRDLYMIDINPKATALAKINAIHNLVKCEIITNDSIGNITENFACILTNPPIRAGKNVVYNFFTESFNHLKKGGELWFVMRRNHGVESAIKKIDELFNNHEVIKRKNGFWIVKAIKLN